MCDSFEESDPKTRVRYEEEFLDHLEKMVRDLDRRIVRGRDRLQRSVDAKQKVVWYVCIRSDLLGWEVVCLDGLPSSPERGGHLAVSVGDAC